MHRSRSIVLLEVCCGAARHTLPTCARGGRVWDMDALVCRRTLLGHRDDVLHISGLPLGAAGGPSPPTSRGATPDGDADGAANGFDPAEEPSPGCATVTAALFASASADGVRV